MSKEMFQLTAIPQIGVITFYIEIAGEPYSKERLKNVLKALEVENPFGYEVTIELSNDDVIKYLESNHIVIVEDRDNRLVRIDRTPQSRYYEFKEAVIGAFEKEGVEW